MIFEQKQKRLISTPNLFDTIYDGTKKTCITQAK